jgi:hypothetical protein
MGPACPEQAGRVPAWHVQRSWGGEDEGGRQAKSGPCWACGAQSAIWFYVEGTGAGLTGCTSGFPGDSSGAPIPMQRGTWTRGCPGPHMIGSEALHPHPV